MPSGAKKRKAAKKKKENQSTNNPNSSSASTHSHDMVGGDEVKHHDDKESSDVGEVSSPTSQDQHREEEEHERENVLNLPSTERAKIEVADERTIVIEGTAIPVEREFKIEDESNDKNGRSEHDDTSKKSYDGGSSESSSSSGSSSDDESHGTKSSQAVVYTAPVVDSVKVADTFSGEHVEAIESTNVEVASDSIVENVPAVVSEKIPSLGEKAELDVSTPAITGSSSVVESEFKENGENKQSSVEGQVGISEVCKDAVSQLEETIIPDVENIANKTDDHLSLSYNAPSGTADNGAYAEKDSGVTEPLLVPAPQPVQTTSWKNCCGLFELFTGSGR